MPILPKWEPPILDLKEYASKLPNHLHISTDVWTVARFRKDEVNFRPRHILDDFDKWTDEYLTKPETTAHPQFIQTLNNVLPLTGLTESAKRDTGETATTVKFLGIGTGATAEAESQITLVTEDTGGGYARKDLSVTGQRKVTSQTARFGDTFDDGDVSAVPITLREAGLFTLSAVGVMHARILHSATTLNTGDLHVVQFSELHANGVL